MFKLYVGQVQCKHIIFGGSSDNGYARLLGPYSGNDLVRKRVTLLEGPPFAAELSDLVNKFHKTSFPTVFRSVKLPSRRVSRSTTPPLATSSRPTSWASTVAQLNALAARIAPLPSHATPAPGISRNIKGQRIDLPIRADQAAVITLKSKKLCNFHHLNGACPFRNCNYDHKGRLDDRQKDALRVVARMAPCTKGIYCAEEKCLSGHQCSLSYCEGKLNCKFAPIMHGVDTRVVG